VLFLRTLFKLNECKNQIVTSKYLLSKNYFLFKALKYLTIGRKSRGQGLFAQPLPLFNNL
ncbi:hypothetical protein, partial [Streptococcus loxodontisalivarius]